VKDRDCPAAVSGNERRHSHWPTVSLAHGGWEATVSRLRRFFRHTSASPKTCQRLNCRAFDPSVLAAGRCQAGRFICRTFAGKDGRGMLLINRYLRCSRQPSGSSSGFLESRSLGSQCSIVRIRAIAPRLFSSAPSSAWADFPYRMGTARRTFDAARPSRVAGS